MGEQLYTEIWEKALPDMIALWEDGQNPAGIKLPEDHFRTVGNRDSYTFRLEVENGRILNNIDGSAVARDLAGVFLTNSEALELSKRYCVILRLDSNFTFSGSLEYKRGGI